ncbi:hypothetical protein HRW13_25375, partial [Streptomyces lunaelactis]|uniref:hypothetical protein n=1 Tax=Streptomyces lunaelactis TaxID=1535768 RepID=UPI001584B987
DLADAIGEDGEIDFAALDWDPEAESAFLDGVLGNLYLLTVTEDAARAVGLGANELRLYHAGLASDGDLAVVSAALSGPA